MLNPIPITFTSSSQRLRYKQIAQIEPNLFVGGNQASDPLTLQELGITHVFHVGIDVPIKLDTVTYEKLELEDFPYDSQRMLEVGVPCAKKVTELLSTGQNKVVVCCQAGRSRSVSVIVLYLMSKYPEMTLEEIIRKIDSVRLNNINIGFMKALQEYYRSIHG
jgi:protein-tyrosine phosphatase